MALVFEGELEQSFLAGLLFAAHPVHVEAVTGLVGRAEILSALFLILAGCCYAQSKRPGFVSSVVWMLLAVAMCAAAMLGKEQGITSFAVLATYEIFCTCTSYRREQQRQQKQPEPQYLGIGSIIRVVLLAAVAIALLLWRIQLMAAGGGAPQPSSTQNPGWHAPTSTSKQLTLAYYVVMHFWLLLCPLTLCCDWSHDAIELITRADDPRNIATALLALALLLAALSLLYPKPGWEFRALNDTPLVMGMAILLLPFLPSANILFPVGFAVAERVLYTPSIGACRMQHLPLLRLGTLCGCMLLRIFLGRSRLTCI
jgi:hypothetical protein